VRWRTRPAPPAVDPWEDEGRRLAPQLSGTSAAVVVGGDPDVAARTIEGGQDAAAEGEALADRWRMAHYLGRLPEEERMLLRMRFYEELSQTEIAERTGVALGTVKARMVRGLRRLRELIEAEEGVLAR